MAEEFDVVIPGKKEVAAKETEIELSYAKRKEEALKLYDPENRLYATYLNEGATSNTISYDTLENLSLSPQSDLNKTEQIISICRQYVNKNDIIGLTVEAIENNINTDVRFSYPLPKKGVFRKSDIEKAKALIEDFNAKIKLEKFIPRSILTTFVDGTFICALRKVGEPDDIDYNVDFYPVGIAQVSDYDLAGDPYVVVDMTRLKSALQKSYPKNKKRKGLFFDDVQHEIQATYPDEVVRAYRDNENYAKLPVENTGVVRVNNQNKKYGLSCIFRALYPVMMLEAFDKADRSNALARSKKIIAQLMNKEILGPDFDRDTYDEQAMAHKNLLDAWKQSTVVVTAAPTVKDVVYVEPRVEMTSIDTVNYYRTRAMSTLGISFLMDVASTSMGVANISLKQLMRRINKISRQVEDVLVKWYRAVLKDNGLNPALAPSIEIIDSEMLEMSMKIDLAKMLFGTLNCSYETAYETLGLSLDDERIRREAENELKLEEVFSPRLTPYTVGGGSGGKVGTTNPNGAHNIGNIGGGGGRPADQDSQTPDKQAYDQQYYQDKKDM